MALVKNSLAIEQVDKSREMPAVPWERIEQFVGQLTHDIRNGLNALELQLTFLGEISTDPEAINEIKHLRGSLGNVTRQLQTLRTATGVTTPYPLEYPAEEFFDDLYERFAKMRLDIGEKVVWTLALEPDVLLSVDPELTISALLELLANAVQFAPQDAGTIRVQVSSISDHTSFVLQEPQSITPSVPPDDWGRTPLLTTRRGAYGLGLFRARRCLEIQRGTMEVSYSTENQILTTTVTLHNAPRPNP